MKIKYVEGNPNKIYASLSEKEMRENSAETNANRIIAALSQNPYPNRATRRYLKRRKGK